MDKLHQAYRPRAVIRAELRIIRGKKVNELRLAGLLPVQLYGEGIESRVLQVNLLDFEKVFKKTGETNLLDLKIGDTIRQVYIKNLHFNKGSQIPVHADFYHITSEQDYDSLSQAEEHNEKPALQRRFSKIPLAGLSLVVLLVYLGAGIYRNQSEPKKLPTISQPRHVLGVQTQNESTQLPVRLIVPAINVDANIQHVGVNTKGEMDVPSNFIDVGWFKPGPRPGEKGSSVIAGHYDSENGQKGVFNNLDKLKIGDKVIVGDGSGKLTNFIVREKRLYDPGYADEVFSKSDSSHLNLITCDGVWENAQKSYSKRLVVFADIQ